MKRLFSLVALVAIIAASNCTRVPDNNDPVIGIWIHEELGNGNEKGEAQIKDEWIFNDAYLGRYHRYNDKQVEFLTDFRWERVADAYHISYPGTEMPEQVATMKETPDGKTILEDADGNVLAIRE